MVLPLLKLGTLALKTLSKPIAARLKKEAGLHPKFRNLIISMAQVLLLLSFKLEGVVRLFILENGLVVWWLYGFQNWNGWCFISIWLLQNQCTVICVVKYRRSIMPIFVPFWLKSFPFVWCIQNSLFPNIYCWHCLLWVNIFCALCFYFFFRCRYFLILLLGAFSILRVRIMPAYAVKKITVEWVVGRDC